jgi:hypothetical protein
LSIIKYTVVIIYTSILFSVEETISVTIFKIECLLSIMQAISGWTMYVIHPGIFFIENFIIAKIVQPSVKVRLISILF